MTRPTISSGALVLIICPSTRMISSVLTRSPNVATLPLTDTRPDSIQVSNSRREPRPPRANTFCSFSLMFKFIPSSIVALRLQLILLTVLFGVYCQLSLSIIINSGVLFSCNRLFLLFSLSWLAAKLCFKTLQHRIHLLQTHQGGLINFRFIIYCFHDGDLTARTISGPITAFIPFFATWHQQSFFQL